MPCFVSQYKSLYKYTAMHGTIYVWNAVVMSGWADLLLVVFEFLDKLEFFDW